MAHTTEPHPAPDLPPRHHDAQLIAATAVPAAVHLVEGAERWPADTEIIEEAAAARRMAEQYGIAVRIIPNGNTGLIVRFGTDLPKKISAYDGLSEKYGDWPWPRSYAPVVGVDVDDTLLAYTAAKEPRQALYDQHVTDIVGEKVDPALLEQVMTATDKFSRWRSAGEEIYHQPVHQRALELVTDAFVRMRAQGATPEEAAVGVQDMIRHLETAAEELGPRRASVLEEHDSIATPETATASLDLSDVFKPAFEPQQYDETMMSLQDMASGGARVVGFTYGETKFQFEKVLRLYKAMSEAGKDWPFTDFFLTKRPKGEFLERLLLTAQIDPIVKENFLSDDPHAFLLIDDDPRQLESFMSREVTVRAVSGAHLAAIRSVRGGTKTQGHPWPTHDRHPVDPSSRRRQYTPSQRWNIPHHGAPTAIHSTSDLGIQVNWTVQDLLHTLIDDYKQPDKRSVLPYLQAQLSAYSHRFDQQLYLGGIFDTE